MNPEYNGPLPDAHADGRRPSSELWGPWEIANEDTRPLVRYPTGQEQTRPLPVGIRPEVAADPQFSYREHVTGSLAAHPAEAPLFHPAYPAQMYSPLHAPPPPVYQQHPGYPAGYPSPYAGYAGHPAYAYPPPYAWQPPQPQPKRDGYLLAMAIFSLVGSSLVLLVGLAALTGLLLLATTLSNKAMNDAQFFYVDMITALVICVGIFGGSSGLYHSIRSLMKKSSAAFSLPWFWIFLVLYLAVVGIGFALHSRGQEVAFPALSVTLILLAGFFPALAVAAIAVRRLRMRAVKPLKTSWSTSWRRFTLALLSGATLSVLLAAVLELVLLLVTVLLAHAQAQGMQNLASCLNTPDVQSCQNTGAFSIIFLNVAVVAPLVEETVKPLAVILLIGRVRSAAEAFVLGLASGIGFDLVETSLYISGGYHDWLNIALTRTGAGLLHGFGAAMVTLGWYYLTHTQELGRPRALLRSAACWSYAVFQHALWNGSATLVLLPGPVGRFLHNWTVNLGFTVLPFDVTASIVEALLMLAFFVYLTGRLRGKPSSPDVPPMGSEEQKEGVNMPSEASVGGY